MSSTGDWGPVLGRAVAGSLLQSLGMRLGELNFEELRDKWRSTISLSASLAGE